jgi:oligopeptide/dipeptide ABC transporter ATP-binding protein
MDKQSIELKVENLTTRFGEGLNSVTAADKVTFDLHKEETLAIVGESGSGKSATALSLLRLLPPSGKIVNGSVWFDSGDILTYSGKQLQSLRGNQISMVFQDPMTSLNPAMTIGQQIVEPLFLHLKLDRKKAKQRAVELLDIVKLPNPEGKMDSYPHQLSGGMKQRVMIAIALACSPKVLIADEPTTALDVLIQAQILELFDSLKKKINLSMILITHDLGVVSGMADRTLVMYAGEIVESGPTQELLNSPLHPYTVGLLNCRPRRIGGQKRKRLTEIPGTISRNDTQGCSFYSRCSSAMDRCKIEKPPFEMVSPGHSASCWLNDTN